MSKFDELKKVAEAATLGPWTGDRYDDTIKYDVLGADGEIVIHGDNSNSVSGPFGIMDEKNENFILAANPAAILELLAIQAQLVEALKDAIKELNAYSEADSGESFNNPAMNDALSAAGAQP